MGPLSGIRVLEFAGIGPGPFCGMLLADLGAEVVVITRTGGEGTPLEARYDLLNRGKRSAAINLKHPRGVETALRLADHADVVLEGYRPGVMERLGLGPDVCFARNARLVYGRMTGWGQDGPLAERAGHDINYIALAGALHAIGRKDEPPVPPVNFVGDFGGGALYLALGVVAALFEARQSGRGQVVDAAIVDGTASLLTPLYGLLARGWWVDRRGENVIDGGAPWYDVYQTRDGDHIAVGPIEPKFFAEFADATGLGADAVALQWDREHWPALRERLAATFRQRTRGEWEEAFEGRDVCAAPVLGMRESPVHPHLASRGTFVDVDGIVQPAPAPRFSRTPGAIRHRPPEPGADTTDVLVEWGLSRSEVVGLREEGAIG